MQVKMKHIDEHAMAQLRDVFGATEVAHDKRCALFNSTTKPIIGAKLSRLAYECGQPVEVAICAHGDTVSLSDGTRYIVSATGNWIRQ